MDVDPKSIVIGIIVGVFTTYLSFEVVGLRKRFGSWIKDRTKYNKKKNEERKRFHQDFHRLVCDSQVLRSVSRTHTTSQFPQGKINRLKSDLTRTAKYIRPAAKKIAQETIVGGEKMIKNGKVGDEFVDYLEEQFNKANNKNRITPPR